MKIGKWSGENRGASCGFPFRSSRGDSHVPRGDAKKWCRSFGTKVGGKEFMPESGPLALFGNRLSPVRMNS